jgi:8-oxo-dGTP pyrophosphatase MutT (NUDIX family)
MRLCLSSDPPSIIAVTIQSAAIPYKIDNQGKLQVLLVTSRRTRRWIIPKGKIGAAMLPSRSAEREAFEEAGVLGRISKQPVGSYWQGDALLSGPEGSILVFAYALEVIDELPVWAEMHQRERRWFTLKDALLTVRDSNIRSLLMAFRQHHKR